jgi:hypothetical protein
MEPLRRAVQADRSEAVCPQLTRTMLNKEVQDDTAIVVVRRFEVIGEQSPRAPQA